MAPIEGVIQVQGDITNARTAEVVCTEVLPLILLTDVMFFFPFTKHEFTMPLLSQ